MSSIMTCLTVWKKAKVWSQIARLIFGVEEIWSFFAIFELERAQFFSTPPPHLHRIGRTGRFGKTGIAVNFISNDKDAVILKDIESHFGKKIEELNVHDIDDMEEKLM